MNFHSDDELFFMQNNQNFKNHSEHLREFNDTALLINSLDGVISVDTSLVHLSGALEVNTKLILPKIDSDFRWHLRSSKSDWYKSVKIYRQTSHSSLQDLLNKALLDFI
jgi:ADP-heptose:LPS heptosyltransferase